MFELTLIQTVIACLTIFFAAAIQTAIGFGLALVAVPILLLVDSALVPAPVVMSAFAQLVYPVWSHRHDIDWSKIKMAVVGRFPGTFVAMGLMTTFAESGLKIFIAVSVLAAVVMSLLKISAEPNQRNHLIAGFFSGISGTTAGIGGPPIALLYQHQKGDVIRANLGAFFLVGAIISLAGMGAVGFVTISSWIYGALFLPSTLIGVWAGSKLKSHLKPELMRPLILTLCSASALAVMAREFTSLI